MKCKIPLSYKQIKKKHFGTGNGSSHLKGRGEDHHGQPGLQPETISKQNKVTWIELRDIAQWLGTCSACSRPNMREPTDSCKAVLTSTPMLQHACLYTCTCSKLKCNINNNFKDMPPQSIVIKYHFMYWDSTQIFIWGRPLLEILNF